MGQIKVPRKEICERDILEAFIGIVINVNGEGISRIEMIEAQHLQQFHNYHSECVGY